MEKGNIKSLTTRLKELGYSQTDISYINNAYEIAHRSHAVIIQNTDAQLKKQYLHLIYTAYTLAELRLDVNTIAASLMHDLLYTCNIDSDALKQMFPEVLVQYLEGMKEFHNMTMEYLKGGLTQSTQDLLKRSINNHVILISAAKRIDRLNEFAHVREEERPYYLDNTNDLVKKLVEKEGSFYLSDQLSECWLRCKAFYKDTDKNPNDYNDCKEKYKKLLRYNKPSTEKTVAFLKDTFAGRAKDMSSDTIQHTRHIKDMYFTERLISDIFKHIKEDERQGATQPFSKWNVPLYDITLIFNNSVSSTRFLVDEFIYIFQYYLRDHLITIKDYLLTNDNAPYFVIADRWENRYRVFLRTTMHFRRYQIGDIVEEEYSAQAPSYQPPDKGTVHIINNQTEYDFPAGYSSLDYAFMSTEYNGLYFQKMVINNTVIDAIGDVKMHRGDIGKVFFSNTVTAKLSWFNYIETVLAREQLINYFQNRIMIR